MQSPSSIRALKEQSALGAWENQLTKTSHDPILKQQLLQQEQELLPRLVDS